MKTIEIKVSTKREGSDEVFESTTSAEIPENLQEMTEVYGETICYDLLESQVRTNIQNIARAALRENKDVAASYAGYKPGVARARVLDPQAAALNAFAKMGAEEQLKLLEMLKAKAGL